MDHRTLLHDVADRAADWFDELPHRPVGPQRTSADLEIADRLGDGPIPVDQVIADLAGEAAPGLAAMGSPRFFGFVIGAAHPAGVAADWLATDVGPERRARRPDPERLADRGDRRPLARRPARDPADRVVRARHRLPDGARHGPRGGAQPRPGRRGPRRRAPRAHRRPADPGAGRGGAPRDRRPRAAAARLRHRRDRAGGRRRARRDARRRARGGPRDRRAGDADDRHRPGRQREHGCERPDARGVRRRQGRGRLGPRRRRVRALGGGEPQPARHDRGRRERRLVGHGRAQVAAGALRLRDRVRPRPRGAPRRDGVHRRVPRPGRGRPTRADGLDARVLPPGARAGGLRHPALARPRGRRRARRSPLRVRGPLRRPAPGRGLRGAVARAQPGPRRPRVRRGDRRRARGDPGGRARAGRAGRPGAGGAASGSRSAATSRRSTTSTGRSTRWRPARADDACARPRRAGSSGCRGDRRDLRRDAPARRDEGVGPGAERRRRPAHAVHRRAGRLGHADEPRRRESRGGHAQPPHLVSLRAAQGPAAHGDGARRGCAADRRGAHRGVRRRDVRARRSRGGHPRDGGRGAGPRRVRRRRALRPDAGPGAGRSL